jgi:hypothetical protein
MALTLQTGLVRLIRTDDRNVDPHSAEQETDGRTLELNKSNSLQYGDRIQDSSHYEHMREDSRGLLHIIVDHVKPFIGKLIRIAFEYRG